MKIVATIEARMSSSRLPGKVLMEAAGVPLLKHMTDRVKKSRHIDEIVLATTINGADDVLVDFAKNEKISFYRGSEDDVMGRVLEAAHAHKADTVVELTGDCPLIDPHIIDQCVDLYLGSECDYASNCAIRSYPDGMDVQVFSTETLARSASITNDPFDREHVTLHIRNNRDIFRLVDLVAPNELSRPTLGLTLDEQDDYEFLKAITEALYEDSPYFCCEEILKYLDENPDICLINEHVARTTY